MFCTDIAVIGGGASGLIAAIHAASCGLRTTILERNPRIGKKLLMTGNSHCNLTNRQMNPSNFHGDPDFAMKVIETFNVSRTIHFFNELGIEISEEPDGKMYPASYQASSVLDVLRFECSRLKIDFQLSAFVRSIRSSTRGFEISGDGFEPIICRTVILSTGGKACPDSGSDGSGYRLAEMTGHRVVSLRPSLTQIKLDGRLHKTMEGMRWQAGVSAVIQGKILKQSQGDVIFTPYGISGTAILDISRTIVEALEGNLPAVIEMDLLPGFQETEILERLNRRVTRLADWTMENFLSGWMNKRIGQALVKSLEIALTRSVSSLQAIEIKAIAERMKHWRFNPSGHTGWQNAQVTAGGIDTRQVCPETMESKLFRGLYFAGEVLDIDGDSGGYNLQWAWSSGAVAGSSSGSA